MLKKKKDTGKYFTLNSNKLYLKTSNYLLHVNYGNENFQKEFYLSPREFQKINKDTVRF